MLLVLPTGCGKTVLFSCIAAQFLERGQRVMVLAHRQELLSQARSTMSKMFGSKYNMQVCMSGIRLGSVTPPAPCPLLFPWAKPVFCL